MSTANQSLQATALCTFFLFLKCWITALQQGGAQTKLGTRPPQDSLLDQSVTQNFGLEQKTGEQTAQQKQLVENSLRWGRILGNDLENIPIGLIVAWADVICSGNSDVHIIAISLFTFGRVGHTIAYANGLQPWRTILFLLGILSVFTMGINSVIGAFKL